MSLKGNSTVPYQTSVPAFSWQPLGHVGDSKFVLFDLVCGLLKLFANGIASVSKALFALLHGRVHVIHCHKPRSSGITELM